MARILLVDDNGPVRRLLTLTISRTTHEVREATNGAEALEAIAQWRPHLVFLDIMMPGDIDGLEVCRRVKQDASLGKVIVVLLTARGQSADVEAGYAAGADDYLVKPVSPTKLSQLTERLLAGGTAQPTD
jgi:CheY-like chemotaxis protein